MKKKKKSKSIFRERLYVQGKRDEASGLLISGRVFLPEKEIKNRRFLWYLADYGLLLMILSGLFWIVTTGFSMQITLWLYPCLFLECAGFLCLFQNKWSRKFWPGASMLVFLIYAVILYLRQREFLNGMYHFYYQVLTAMNQAYDGEIQIPQFSQNIKELSLFLILIAVPVVLWLIFSLYERGSLLLASLLFFPLFSLLFLCGANANPPALFLVFFGVLGMIASSRTIKRRRMWGDKDERLYTWNLRRFHRIQKKNILFVLGLTLLLTIPGFYLVRPFLGLQLKPAEQMALRLRSQFLSRVLQELPELTANQWNLEVETSGGGVSDGSLGAVEGYDLQGVEDLQVTISEKPKETIFLKGYVGSTYQNGGWESPVGTTFDGAAMNWKTEGNARLYVQNLPFLRTLYALSQKEEGKEEIRGKLTGLASAEPVQLSVERIHANERYTYVPYGAYLNEYYEIFGGDGGVEGQKGQEDRFLFFYREEYEEILRTWNEIENTENVLDRVEEAYHGLSRSINLEVAEELEEYQEQIDKLMKEKKWKPEKNRGEITDWIRQYLAEGFTYDLGVKPAPEDKDFLLYFLSESKTGYSIHYATAAVEFFRMFGIPARYVVGYEVPATLFSPQSDGSYRAILQDDNSQAWAEIYVDGVGWLPQDMTPGIIGTLEEVGPGGEKIIRYDQKETQEQQKELSSKEKPFSLRSLAPTAVISKFTAKLNTILAQPVTVEQVIHALVFLLIFLLLLIFTYLIARRICRDWGLNPFHRKTETECLLQIYTACYRRTLKKGFPSTFDTASQEYLEFVHGLLQKKRRNRGREVDLTPFIEMRDFVYACYFGDVKPDGQDIKKMRMLYCQLLF